MIEFQPNIATDTVPRQIGAGAEATADSQDTLVVRLNRADAARFSINASNQISVNLAGG